MFLTGTLLAVLLIQIYVCHGDDPPLSEQLWDDNIWTANKVYETKFIQGMRVNNLDEQIFRQLHIPDILYLATTIEKMEKAYKRCKGQVCTELDNMINKYKDYLPGMLKEANLESTASILSTPAFDAYANHYEMVATQMDPAYMIVAMYPCSRLWNWMAKKLEKETDLKTNVYWAWIKDNASGSGGSSIKAFIDSYKDFDIGDVKRVFSVSMQMEYGIFEEASEKIVPSVKYDEL